MKYTKIILLLSAVLLLGSCMDNFLDVKPMGKLIPEKAADFENLLNNDNTVDFQFLDGNRGIRFAYLGDNYKITQALSENRFTPGAVNMDRYAAYIFYDPVSNPMERDYIWDNLYQAISVFNSVIDGIEGLSEGEKNSDLGKRLIAQAKAARAWCYLNGVFIWGPMWNPAGNNDTKVMPYRTAASPVVSNPDLNTTAEILEFIKTDLDEALNNVPEQVSNPSRANKTAVKALLAQYYMYKRNWNEMLKYANESWTESLARVNGDPDKLIYNLNDFKYIEKNVTPKPGESREVYLSLGYFPDGVMDGSEPFKRSYNRESLFFRVGTFSSGEDYLPSDEFIALFDPAKDKRYQLFMLDLVGSGNELVKSYYRSNTDKMENNVNNGITYPELLLMRAEAYARSGNTVNALADLNLLRKYRYSGSVTDLTGGEALNQDALLYEILKERRREMNVGSHQRFIDLKRYIYDSGKPWSKSVIEHKIGSQTYSKPLTDPIFNSRITNVIISYNPHWGLEPDNRSYQPK